MIETLEQKIAELSQLLQRCARAAREAGEIQEALQEFLQLLEKLTGSSRLELPEWGELKRSHTWEGWRVVISRPGQTDLPVTVGTVAEGRVDPERLAEALLSGLDRTAERLEAVAALARAVRRALKDEEVLAELVVKQMRE